jgi:hypothetical protein
MIAAQSLQSLVMYITGREPYECPAGLRHLHCYTSLVGQLFTTHPEYSCFFN